jgi:hypothetical protein
LIRLRNIASIEFLQLVYREVLSRQIRIQKGSPTSKANEMMLIKRSTGHFCTYSTQFEDMGATPLVLCQGLQKSRRPEKVRKTQFGRSRIPSLLRAPGQGLIRQTLLKVRLSCTLNSLLCRLWGYLPTIRAARLRPALSKPEKNKRLPIARSHGSSTRGTGFHPLDVALHRRTSDYSPRFPTSNYRTLKKFQPTVRMAASEEQ